MEASSNLNDFVWVRLTAEGKSQLGHYYAEGSQLADADVINNIVSYHEVEEGWSKFQLHELMNIFGSRLYNGATEQMFEQNMISHTAKPHR